MERIRILLPAVAGLVAASLLVACGKDDKAASDHSQADALYAELRTAYIAYTDSIARIPAADTSGMFSALEARFDRRIKDIYWRYPQNLDYELTPAQNDSLWHYASRYIELRRQRLKPEPADTLEVLSDSLEVI